MDAETLLPGPSNGFDIEDVAADFIEQEVGRFDWRRNWQQLRGERDMVEHARAWVTRYQVAIKPEELVTWIDDYARRERAHWC